MNAPDFLPEHFIDSALSEAELETAIDLANQVGRGRAFIYRTAVRAFLYGVDAGLIGFELDSDTGRARVVFESGAVDVPPPQG